MIAKSARGASAWGILLVLVFSAPVLASPVPLTTAICPGLLKAADLAVSTPAVQLRRAVQAFEQFLRNTPIDDLLFDLNRNTDRQLLVLESLLRTTKKAQPAEYRLILENEFSGLLDLWMVQLLQLDPRDDYFEDGVLRTARLLHRVAPSELAQPTLDQWIILLISGAYRLATDSEPETEQQDHFLNQVISELNRWGSDKVEVARLRSARFPNAFEAVAAGWQEYDSPYFLRILEAVGLDYAFTSQQKRRLVAAGSAALAVGQKKIAYQTLDPMPGIEQVLQSQYASQSLQFPIKIDGGYEIPESALRHILVGDWRLQLQKNAAGQTVSTRRVLVGGLHTELGIIELMKEYKEVEIYSGEIASFTNYDTLDSLASQSEVWRLSLESQLGGRYGKKTGEPETTAVLVTATDGVLGLRIPTRAWGGKALKSTERVEQPLFSLASWKTLFPSNWNTDTIIQAIRAVLKSPEQVSGSPANRRLTGHYTPSASQPAIRLQVWLDGKQVHTAYPLWAEDSPPAVSVHTAVYSLESFQSDSQLNPRKPKDVQKFNALIKGWLRSHKRDLNLADQAYWGWMQFSQMLTANLQLPLEERLDTGSILRLIERMSTDANREIRSWLGENRPLKDEYLPDVRAWIDLTQAAMSYFQAIGDSPAVAQLAPIVKRTKYVQSTLAKLRRAKDQEQFESQVEDGREDLDDNDW